MEVWKDVKGYEGHYQVSNKGRVRSLDIKVWNGKGFMVRRGRVLKKLINKVHGYEYVNLSKTNKVRCLRVNRLVAIAFIPNLEAKPEVNHINENKLDNRAENLEWVTSKENANHGTRSIRCGEKHRKAVLGKHVKTGEVICFDSFKEAALRGFDQSTIHKCINNKPKYKTHKGYTWSYVI